MFDVCVAGGGPAGATTACYLLRKGYKVALADQSSHPQSRGSESLAPSAVQFLKSNGFTAAIEAAAICEPTATLLSWRDEPEFLSAREKPVLLISRSAFDETIVQRATTEGARLFRPAKALRPRQDAFGWIVPFENGTSIKARYFVDAGGRASLFAHSRRYIAPSTAALYGVWLADDRKMCVEARPNGWLWGAPEGDEKYAVIAFLDPRQCAGLDDRGRRRLYERAVHEADFFRHSVGEHSLGRVGICDATAYMETNPISHNALKVGDASLSVDPVSSQGLQVALRSAWHASIVIHTILSGNDRASAAADFYSASQRGTVEYHKRASRGLYRQHTRYAHEPFWRARIVNIDREAPPTPLSANCPLRLSQDAVIGPVPAIERDLIVHVEGVRHPNLDRPIAYLEGRPAGVLLRMLEDPGPFSALVARWQLNVGMQNAAMVLHWLLERQVLVPASRDDS